MSSGFLKTFQTYDLMLQIENRKTDEFLMNGMVL